MNTKIHRQNRSLNQRKSTLLAFLVALSSIPVSIHAQGIHRFDLSPPAGLQPGQSYRIVFVTNSGIDALSTDLDRYNTFAQQEAAENPILSSLGAEWNAIASTEEINARRNTGTELTLGEGSPIYLVDGTTRIASNNRELWNGAIDNPISLDQNGEAPPQYDGSGVFGLHNPGERLVWTGTQPGGNVDLQFGVAPAPYFAVTYGSAERSDSLWVERHGAETAGVQLPIYALSSEITAIPEPSGLLGFGCLALLSYLRLRRKA